MQFEQLTLPNSILSIHQGDNCILTEENVGLVLNILARTVDNAGKVLVVEWLQCCPASFLKEPLQSSDLRIFRVSRITNDITIIPVQHVTSKCMLLPCLHYFVTVPYLILPLAKETGVFLHFYKREISHIIFIKKVVFFVISWCTGGVGLTVLSFIDNTHLGSILRFQHFSCISFKYSEIHSAIRRQYHLWIK